MKNVVQRLGFAVIGTIALTGMAYAQVAPATFVVTGKAAERIQDTSTINLETARHIAETCEALVTARADKNPAPLDKDGTPIYPIQINGEAAQQTVIILDNAGNHVYYDRMDGQIIRTSLRRK